MEIYDRVKPKEDLDLFDTVCAICDNGGGLVWYALLISYLPVFRPGFANYYISVLDGLFEICFICFFSSLVKDMMFSFVLFSWAHNCSFRYATIYISMDLKL